MVKRTSSSDIASTPEASLSGSTNPLAGTAASGRPAEPPAAARPRLRELDALRGVAILLVLGEHRYISALWTRVGWTGVDLFFVLSGFLISGLLFNEHKRYGTINFRRFFLRRGLKIYPGYYVLLAYFFGRNMIEGRGISRYMLSQLVFLQNYTPGAVDYTWSLAVEEHFYVLLPLCLILLYKAGARASADPFRMLPWIAMTIACGLVLVRAVTNALSPYDIKTHHMATHVRIDSLLFGVLIGYFYHFHRPALRQFVLRWRSLILSASCLCIFSGLIREREDPWMNILGLTGLYIGYGGLLLLVLPEMSVHSPAEGGVISAVRAP